MTKTNQQIAIEVILGKWGNGYSRIEALANAGYDPNKIQSIVNAIIRDGQFPESEDNSIKLGTNTLTIDVDLSKYSNLSLNLFFGDKS